MNGKACNFLAILFGCVGSAGGVFSLVNHNTTLSIVFFVVCYSLCFYFFFLCERQNLPKSGNDVVSQPEESAPEPDEPLPVIEAATPFPSSVSDVSLEYIPQPPREVYASENGLLPAEILMLHYAPRYKTCNNDFPGFWSYQYAVNDPQHVLDSLYNRGFIRLSSASERLCNLTIPELKEILKAFDLKTTGKKAELVSRLQDSVEDAELDPFVPVRNYVLTELGEQELKDNEYVVYLHKDKYLGISIWDINELRHKYPKMPWKDLIWLKFNQEGLSASAARLSGNASAYISLCSRRYHFLMDEKNYANALTYLSEVIYYEVNMSAVQSYLYDLKEQSKPFPFPRYRRILDPQTGSSMLVEDTTPPSFEKSVKVHAFYPYQLDAFKTLQEKLHLSDNDLWHKLMDIFDRLPPTYCIFSDDEIAGVIIAEITGDSDLASKLYLRAEDRILNEKHSQYP